jgi:hypothetical protein
MSAKTVMREARTRLRQQQLERAQAAAREARRLKKHGTFFEQVTREHVAREAAAMAAKQLAALLADEPPPPPEPPPGPFTKLFTEKL